VKLNICFEQKIYALNKKYSIPNIVLAVYNTVAIKYKQLTVTRSWPTNYWREETQ